MKDKFFYRHWWLYYLLFFLLLGVLIYALLWHPKCEVNYPPSYYQQPNTPENPTTPTDGSTAPPAVVNCDAAVESGGYGLTTTTHLLGSKPGTVYVAYEMYTVPDRLTLYYDGNVVASTADTVSGEGRLSFYYKAEKGKPQECKVEVYGPDTRTEWEYQLSCPE